MTLGHRSGRRTDSTKRSLLYFPTKRLPGSGHWMGRVPRILLGQMGSAQSVSRMPFRAHVSTSFGGNLVP